MTNIIFWGEKFGKYYFLFIIQPLPLFFLIFLLAACHTVSSLFCACLLNSLCSFSLTLILLFLLSVGRRWGLWNANPGTVGALYGPAQCITPPPQDALSCSTSVISHFCTISWFSSSVAMLAITPHTGWLFILAWIYFMLCCCNQTCSYSSFLMFY